MINGRYFKGCTPNNDFVGIRGTSPELGALGFMRSNRALDACPSRPTFGGSGEVARSIGTNERDHEIMGDDFEAD